MVAETLAFYRIKKVNLKSGVVYYLVKEWYDPETKRKRSKLIGRCDKIEELIEKLQRIESEWCGGWDLNPRRPTPAGLEPAPFGLARAPPQRFLPQYILQYRLISC